MWVNVVSLGDIMFTYTMVTGALFFAALVAVAVDALGDIHKFVVEMAYCSCGAFVTAMVISALMTAKP